MSTTKPDPKRLDEIRERLAKATPYEKLRLTRYEHGGGRMYTPSDDLVADFYGEADREFYAHAPADISYLLASLEATQGEIRDERLPCGHLKAEYFEGPFGYNDHEGIVRIDEEHPRCHACERESRIERDAIESEEKNPWKREIINWLVTSFILTKENEVDPGKALCDIMRWECTIALDPKVSSDAAKLERDTIRRALQAAAGEVEKSKHDIRCSGWSGGTANFDPSKCDCGTKMLVDAILALDIEAIATSPVGKKEGV